MTIYDIAREAGVSASTVSRVINNKPGIKEETRERVRKLLKKYRYSPDIAARGLVKQSSGIIGILIEDIRVSHHIESAFIIERELTKTGYACITLGTGRDDEGRERYFGLLEDRRAEAVVLVGSMFKTEAVRKLIRTHLKNIPVVLINACIDLPNVNGIMIDEEGGVRAAVEALIKRGRRNIAFVIDSPTVSNLAKRRGYEQAMHDNALAHIKIYEAGNPGLAEGYNATQRLFDSDKKPDAIVYSVDLMAAGGVRYAADMGIGIPEELEIIGVDNSIYSEICIPKISTIDNKRELASMEAARILMECLANKDFKKKDIVLKTSFVKKESTL